MSGAISEDQLLNEFRGYATLVAGRGMHIPVSGDHVRAVLARIDSLTETARATNGNGHTPPPAPGPAWQEPLAGVLRIVAEIIEDPTYGHLCGTNLVDALHAWATLNSTHVSDEALTAVNRALSGG